MSQDFVKCGNPTCGKPGRAKGEMVCFPWGSYYCKGECSDRAREFREGISEAQARRIASAVKVIPAVQEQANAWIYE